MLKDLWLWIQKVYPIIIEFIRQSFCWHDYKQTDYLRVLWAEATEYTCKKCNKIKIVLTEL